MGFQGLSEIERVLACPRCQGALALEAGAFACGGCGARWPVVRGIPRFVDSELYVGSFGYEWRRHRRTQIDSAVRRESERTFAEKTGLAPEDVRGKLVLDVGVGTGRFSDVVARWGGIPVGIDLSLAVLSARRNLAAYFPRALVAQADLFKPPFHEESFDIVFSIGVLHHTPSTRDALRSIARLVRPGGVLAAAVYEYGDFQEPSRRYRRYTSAMSHSFLHALSHLALARDPVVDVARTLLGETPANALRRALFTREHEDPLWRVLDTFDWYSPRYQWVHDEAEVKPWFEELGFEDVRRLPEPTMVSVRGRRPAAGPLRTPPPSEERPRGGLAPLPALVPRSGPLRDLVLLAFLAGAVARELGAVASPIVLHLVTVAVVAAKRALGIERDLLRRAPAG